jgi:predicted Ser/Thr protein kinase
MSEVQASHPRFERLLAFRAGRVAAAEAAEIERHIAGCTPCRVALATLAQPSSGSDLKAETCAGMPLDPNRETTGEATLTAPPFRKWEPWRIGGPRADTELQGQFGRYRILERLGRGAMGSVYLAQDTQLGRRVALKVPHFLPEDGLRVLERFYREARAAATLEHPNLCPVHDVGQIDGKHYLTMAYIEGQPLTECIQPGKPLPQRQVAAVIRKLALALQEAHSHGVVHRDLKPANIMINKRKEPVIMDFGLARLPVKEDARLTRDGTILGTPAYMSPEQVGGHVDAMGPACDVYSLGVILYEMLTGRLPFDGPMASMLVHIAMDPPAPPSTFRPDLDPRLEALCLAALAKKVQERPAMAEFAKVLTDYLRSEGQAQGRGARSEGQGASEHRSVFPRLSSLASRPSPWLWIGAGGAAIVALLLGILTFVKTAEGTVKIELLGPAAGAEVKVDGSTIDIEGLDQPLRFKAGDHQLVVSGKGFETVSRSFTVKRGDNPALTVELVPREQARANVEQGQSKPKLQPPPGPSDAPSPAGKEQTEPGFRRLFVGRDLAAWEGLPQYWTFQDGALEGSTYPAGIDFNTFLCSKKKYRDFELKFQVQMRGDGWEGNSGVQIRSAYFDRSRFAVIGPQAGMGGTHGGSLYGERFGGMMRRADKDAVSRTLKINDFNHYSIKCIGSHVTIKLNGVTTVDDDFATLPAQGIIAWQLHGGKAMEVTFRNVLFKDLSKIQVKQLPASP